MRIRQIKLENYRGFGHLELELPESPGVFALAGANGAGKSSVLDAIAKAFFAYRSLRLGRQDVGLQRGDIRDGATHALVFVRFGSGEPARGGFVEMKADLENPPRSRAMGVVDISVVHYPSNRALDVPTDAGSWRGDDEDAPNDEVLGLVGDMPSFFRWFKREEDLENEGRVRGLPSVRALDEMRSAVSTFLADAQISDLRVERRERRLAVSKAGQTIDVNRLSDGERRMMLLAADLTRRLRAHAQPDTPLAEIEATILIDELELHLHPRWQRSVVQALSRTYPACQFIITTHSPLILSELRGEHVFLLDQFKLLEPAVGTLGRDLNTIVEAIMGGSDRPDVYKDALQQAERYIDEARYDDARAKLAEVEAVLGDLDGDVIRLQSMIALLDEAPRATHP